MRNQDPGFCRANLGTRFRKR